MLNLLHLNKLQVRKFDFVRLCWHIKRDCNCSMVNCAYVQYERRGRENMNGHVSLIVIIHG